VNPERQALRERRDAGIVQFAGAVLLGAVSIASLGIAPWAWFGVLQVGVFLACCAYAVIAWLRMAVAHVQLRGLPPETGAGVHVAPSGASQTDARHARDDT
jgi:hypothetical protein